MKKYITQDTLKKNNTADILTFILERGGATRREIEWETGFSWGTVSSNAALLIERGYLIEEKSESTGSAGRSTCRLVPNGEGVVSIGLDINRTGLVAQIVGLDLSVKESISEPFCAKTQKELITQAEELCARAIDMCEGKYRVFSIGIALQGAVDGKVGFSLRFPGICDWTPYNIKERFESRFFLPVYLGHDPKCMLIAEQCKKKYSDAVLVRIDEGIGMAVSQDGRILDDTERLELGHTVAVRGGELCSCGKRGCLEAYSSVNGICRRADIASERLLDEPKNYLDLISEAAEHLGLALYNICVLFRPQKLVLTGRGLEIDEYVSGIIERFSFEGVELEIDRDISAAFGAAAESMRSAIRSLNM